MRSIGYWRHVAVTVALGTILIAPAVAPVPAPASASPSGIARTSAVADEDETSAEAIASAAAVATETPVVVDERTTETELVEALPDGSFRLTVDSIPSRVEINDEWVPIDTTLHPSPTGEFFEATATLAPVRFSAGGNDVLAQIQSHDGTWLTETWSLGSLPAPLIDGSTATYLSVLPDVDLRLSANATGMTEVLIVHTPEAAALPELRALQLEVDGVDLDVDEQGTIRATPEGLEPSPDDLRSGSPVMWDSSNDLSTVDGPAPDAAAIELDSEVVENVIDLGLDAVSDNAELVYPVFVDPDWTAGTPSAWYMDVTFPDQSYPRGGAFTDSTAMVGYVQPGFVDPNSHRARALWQFNTAPLAGKMIIDAVLNTTETHSYNCGASPVEIWRVDGAVPGHTWNQQTGVASWIQDQRPGDPVTVAHGWNASCPAAPVAFPAKPAAVWAASTSASTVTLGLKAKDETSSTGWKRFSFDVQFIVTYNTRPSVPTAHTIQSPDRSCATSANPSYVPSTIPLTFRARLADADGGNMAARLYVEKSSGSTWTSVLPSPSYLSGPTMAGGYHSVTMPVASPTPLANGTYRWHIRGWDGLHESIAPASATQYCYFIVENDPPATPVLSPGATSGLTIGHPIDVTVTPNGAMDQPGLYQYFWVPDGGGTPPLDPPVDLGMCDRFGEGSVRSTCVQGIDPVLLSVAPIAEESTLWVRTVDEAGKPSPWASHTFSANADPAVTLTSGTGHSWSSSSAPGSPILDSNTVVQRDLSLGNSQNYSFPDADPTGNGAHPVVELTDLVPILIYKDMNGMYADVVGVNPGQGYALVANAGWAYAPDNVSPPTGTSKLCYSPAATNDVLTVTTGSCAAGTTLAGHVRTTAATGWTALRTCSSAAPIGSYVSISTCTPGTVIGYVANIDAIAQTSVAVVDTSETFSVSAHLQANPSGFPGQAQVALSQSSGANSGFTLGISADGRWQFCMTDQRPGADPLCAVSVGTASTDWTFVTGVWDKHNQQMRIYLEDEPNPVAVAWRAPQTFEDGISDGGFTVGNAQRRSGATERWFGLISRPLIFQGVATPTQRLFLSDEFNPEGP